MSDKKSKKSETDSIVIKCIIEEMARHPIAFIPIIQTIMDPKNPDSKNLTKSISESIIKSTMSDNEFKKNVGYQILDMIQQTTAEQVIDIVNQQRLSLSKDSKKYLEHIAKETIINLCEKYFNEKKQEINNIFNDYFKEIKNYIDKQINETHNKVKKEISESEKKNVVSVEIPACIRDEVVKYSEFLQKQ